MMVTKLLEKILKLLPQISQQITDKSLNLQETINSSNMMSKLRNKIKAKLMCLSQILTTKNMGSPNFNQIDQLSLYILISHQILNFNNILSEDMQGEFNRDKCIEFVNTIFDKEGDGVIASLSQFIKIPNQSREYDKQWATNGLLQKAADHIKSWVQNLGIKGLTTEVLKDEGYTPIIFTQIAGDIPEKTIFFYGHFDKQPPFTGWDEGKGATIPVIEDGKLYGRGGGDDGYSTYSSMVAVKAVQDQGLKIPRIVMITEGDEESGDHVEHYIAKYAQRIGNPDVIFCLDSGSIDYEHMWLTNSLRGYLMANLRVQVLTEGVHSGDASGVVPAAYRIINMLINRIENNETGEIHHDFWEEVPPNRYQQAYNLVADFGPSVIKDYPWADNTHAVQNNTFELVMNRTWRPQLTVTGFTGLQDVSKAGNVSVPEITVKLSMRLPPNADGPEKIQILKEKLLVNPPYDCVVTLDNIGSGNGWNAPEQPEWLHTALNESAQLYFGKPLQGQGQGGSIPLMGFLSKLWPSTQFVVTGILGPNSNAHGPNEFLHIEYCKKLTQAMAHVVYKASLPGSSDNKAKKERKKIHHHHKKHHH